MTPGTPLLLDHTLPGIEPNLALEEVLLQEVEEGRLASVVRFWETAEHAVVLGASGRVAQDVHLEACRAEGARIARRSSGGGTVVIGPGALNVAVVLPIDLDPELRTIEGAQGFVLERHAAALRAAGPAVEVLGSGDLALGGRKVAGSAQRRLRRAVLVHSTLLYRFDLERISRYLAMPARQPAYRAGRSHAEFVTNLPLGASDIRARLAAAWDARPGDADLLDRTRDRLDAMLASQFADPAWIHRF